jgi:GNAT superfamily N-acetyltransferase
MIASYAAPSRAMRPITWQGRVVRGVGQVTLYAVSAAEIRPTRYGAPVARTLVDALQADLAARYGSGDENPVGPGEFDPPEGGFLVAWCDGQPVACAGWRNLGHIREEFGEDVAELKRMYAVPAVRGSGVATELLRALEDTARAAGMRRMVLETGQRQPEAIRFYQRNGYQRITDYGYYRHAEDVVSLGRDL